MEIVSAYDRADEFLSLVAEYTESIAQYSQEVRQCLQMQRLNSELADIESKYGLPCGRMYLAILAGKAAGCVALTKNDSEYCEIKRLYVKPQFRGMNIGKALTEKVIEDARAIGYKYMRLDTFPFMDKAIKLYEKYGFYYIGRYNGNPAKTAIFMQLDL